MVRVLWRNSHEAPGCVAARAVRPGQWQPVRFSQKSLPGYRVPSGPAVTITRPRLHALDATPAGLDIGTGCTKVSGGKRSAVFPTLCAMAQARSVRNVTDMDIGADGGSGIVERVGNDAIGLDLRR